MTGENVATDHARNGTTRADNGKHDNARSQNGKPEPTDDLVTTRHPLTVGDRQHTYTVTTGRIVLRQERQTDDEKFDGHQPKAEIFLTAYTMDGADPLKRPVTFAFNGGPGSSSVWLHMGLLGPRRVVMGDAGDLRRRRTGWRTTPRPCCATRTWCSSTRCRPATPAPIKGEKPKDYHGYTGDIESVGEVIRLWTSRNGRWMSPKYLCGESYGTLRAAGAGPAPADTVRHVPQRPDADLRRAGPRHAGVHGHNDTPYALYLPTYAAIAHYHGLHGDRPLREVLAEAEAYASRDYPWALARGSRLTAEERAAAVARWPG